MPEPFALTPEKGAVVPINEDPTDGGRTYDYTPGYLGQQVVDVTTGSVYVSTGVTPSNWLLTAVGTGAVDSVFGRTGVVAAANGDYAGVVATHLTGATAATRYVGGTATGAPGSGSFLKGDFVIDQTAAVWVCTTAGSPGTWTEVGGGGSQPGIQALEWVFTERATAGVFTATLDLPEGATVLDVQALPLAVPWAADTALLAASDGQGVGYLSVDLNSDLIETATDVVGDGATLGANWQNTRNNGGAHSSWTWFGGEGTPDPGPGVRYAADDTLTITVTTTILAPPVVPSGIVAVRVYYVAPLVSGAVAFA